MDLGLHEIAHGVDHRTLPCQAAHAGEGGTDDGHSEMALAFGTRTGMTGMLGRLIFDFETAWCQSTLETLAKKALHTTTSHKILPITTIQPMGSTHRHGPAACSQSTDRTDRTQEISPSPGLSYAPDHQGSEAR